MQRIPGVTLSRTDGGEGRNISVRGLGPELHPRAHQRHGRRLANRIERHLRRRQQRAQLRLQHLPDRNLLLAHGAQDARRRMSRKDPWVQRSTFGLRVLSITWTKTYSRSRAAVSTTRFPKTSIRAFRCSRRKSSSTIHSACSSRPPIQERFIREVGYSAVDILSANTNANDLTPAPAPARTFLPFCTPLGWTATGPSPAIG